MRTLPVKLASGPLADGCEPLLLISIVYLPKRSKRYASSGPSSPPVAVAQAHAAEAEGRHFEAALSQFAFLHRFSSSAIRVLQDSFRKPRAFHRDLCERGLDLAR